MSPSYRADVDGLRAVAVVMVLIYHLKIPFGADVVLPGGFFGVDVFFVISGFVIARFLLAEFQRSGVIDLGAFFRRRARRLYPPLILVLLASLPAAWVYLPPSQMLVFVKSQIAALAFVANGFWFVEQGAYGAVAAQLHPFLHIWSLSVEGQFYLLFPLVMIALMRAGRVGLGLAVLGVAGFAIACVTTQVNARFSFYAPTSRAWEFAVGAWVAWLTHSGRARGLPGVLRYAPSLALAALAAAALATSFDAAAHPGPITLATVLATAAAILFAHPNDPATRFLSSAPMAWIGRLSYALYLWHFPIFAFGRMQTIAPGPWDMAAWVALSFACAILSYYGCERPLRRRADPSLVWRLSVASTGFVGVFALAMIATDGRDGRRPGLQARYGAIAIDNGRLKDDSWAILAGAGPAPAMWEGNAHNAPSRGERGALWFADPQKRNVLVVGNSHAKDVFNALYLNREAFDGLEFARFGLNPHLPPGQVAALLDAPNFRAADIVLYAPQHHAPMLDKTARFAAMLTRQGKIVVLVGNTAEFDSPSRLPLLDHELRAGRSDLAAINAAAPLHLRPRVATVNDGLRRVARSVGVGYLDRFALVCPGGDLGCHLTTPDGRKALFDYGHWTPDGAKFFGGRMVDWFDDAAWEMVSARLNDGI